MGESLDDESMASSRLLEIPVSIAPTDAVRALRLLGVAWLEHAPHRGIADGPQMGHCGSHIEAGEGARSGCGRW